MFFMGKISEKRSAVESMFDFNGGFSHVFGGQTKAGVNVNERAALSLSAVWSAVKIISHTMGIFPLPVYRRLHPTGKERAPDHSLYTLLHDKPNKYQTAFVWRMLMAIQQLLWGAGISEIEFDVRGNPIALWPIPTKYVQPAETRSGELIYQVTNPKTGKTANLWPHQLLIMPFMPTIENGWLTPIAIHRETIGSALAVREFGALTFGQGTNPAGIVTGIPFGTKDARDSNKKLLEKYSGLNQSHRLMFLYDQMKFERIGIPPEDAQYLSTRQFDISEIARIYNVPLFMLQSHEKSTSWGSGLSEQKDAFITFTMQPFCVQWEQEINTKLLGDNNKYYCKFLMDSLLRGNILDRMKAYQIGEGIGLYDIDELREKEDLNPLADGKGKVRFISKQVQTLDNAIGEDE